MGKGYTRYIKNFELNIYSRWGELLFRTNDPTEAWNGRKITMERNAKLVFMLLLLE